MEFFTIISQNPVETVLQLNPNYTMQLLDNNQIKIITQYIIITDIFKLTSYDFTSSTITNAIVNDTVLPINIYTDLITYLYKLINNGVQIIYNSKLTVKTINSGEPEFIYIDDIGIGYQIDNFNNYIYEICNQSILNKIKLNLTISLNNGTIININL